MWYDLLGILLMPIIACIGGCFAEWWFSRPAKESTRSVKGSGSEDRALAPYRACIAIIDMTTSNEFLNIFCGRRPIGRAPASQAGRCGFKSRWPLQSNPGCWLSTCPAKRPVRGLTRGAAGRARRTHLWDIPQVVGDERPRIRFHLDTWRNTHREILAFLVGAGARAGLRIAPFYDF